MGKGSNAQGLFYANGLLYSSEHGPNTDDEINIIKKGKNYGWPFVKGFCNTPSEVTFCNDSNVVEPLISWTPTVATSGICYYDHPAIPEWEGSLLLTTLKNEQVIQLNLTPSKDSIISTLNYFTNRWGRLRDITTDNMGSVFVATNSFSHKIVKLYNANYTSISEQSNVNNAVSLYPNPVFEELIIEIDQSIQGNVTLEIYNISGKKVLSEDYINRNSVINLSALDSGVYIAKVSNNSHDLKVK